MSEMNWNKHSNILIEVSKTTCPSCEKQFFEIDGYELSFCPHCHADLGSCNYDSQEYRRIYVDYMTGELKTHLPKDPESTE
jgi:predicted amidophosphoribosyltransferase